MSLPQGFSDLVKLAMLERPAKPKNVEEIWDRFLKVALMGGKRGEPDINFIANILKPILALDYVRKTDGEDWRDEANRLIDERASRIKDEDTLAVLRDFQKEIFRISASLKGAARFFERRKILELLDSLKTKEATGEFIEEMVSDEDVSNVKYTKVIIWLHSLGYGDDFCPPSYQTKSFVNEVYGYYQFYEDDKYFMKKAQEISAEVVKTIKKATARDVSMAIFYYITLKSMMPQRTPEKKRCTPAALVKFIKAKKLTLAKISESLSSYDGREKIAENFFEFLHNMK